MVPVIELKGAIPVGMSLGIPEWECFLVALIGSTALSPLIIFFTRRVLNWLMNSKIEIFPPLRELAAPQAAAQRRQI